jgi:hypothetical protein
MNKKERIEELERREYHLEFKMKTALRNERFHDANKYEFLLDEVREEIKQLKDK